MIWTSVRIEANLNNESTEVTAFTIGHRIAIFMVCPHDTVLADTVGDGKTIIVSATIVRKRQDSWEGMIFFNEGIFRPETPTTEGIGGVNASASETPRAFTFQMLSK